MKLNTKRITALILVLLMTSSLLASCGEKTKGISDGPETITIYENYKGFAVDLGLSENEVVMDIIEADGELRATIGVTSDEAEAIYGTGYGNPYQTEYRYYSTGYIEDVSKREKTVSSYEVAVCADPETELVFGGEPHFHTVESGEQSFDGLQYFFYRDGESLGKNIMPLLEDDIYAETEMFGATAHIMLHKDIIYAGILYETWLEHHLYIKDHMVKAPDWRPGLPEYKFCGLIGIDGVPYALLHVWDTEKDEQMVDTLWEEARLVSLTPDVTELPLEGEKIDGIPTGGAFSDGKFGYYFCGSELWRTDGKKSTKIADLISCGVNQSSKLRAVRPISDGRILMVVDDQLIELAGADDGNIEKGKTYTIGVVNLYGNLSELTLTLAKYNRESENVAFTVKEFSDQASLNLALLSGEISMIVTRDQFMLKNYVRQDMLLPLDEVVPEFFEGDLLIGNIVEATQIDGICYYLPRKFDIRGEATDARLLKEGQRLDNREAYFSYLEEQDPDYFKVMTKRSLFTAFAQGIDEWIDWETNTAHFDDGTMEALLEFCNNGSSQEEVDQYTSVPFSMNTMNFVLGDSLSSDYVENREEAEDYIKRADQLLEEDLPFFRKQVIFPLPSSVYDGYEIFTPHYFAVVRNEESQDAAGEFLRWHFLDDVVETFSDSEWYGDLFSINRDENDRYLKRKLEGIVEVPENLSAAEWIYHYEMSKMGEAQYKKTWEVIEKADHFQYFRNDVFDAIYEEAGRYFAGNTTAKQAAEYMQNRISLYLAEQS